MISQQLYDETLLENQEAFDLTPSEAIDETLSQFATQGVDLSHLIVHEHPESELGEKLRKDRRQFESWLETLDRGVNKDGTLSCFDSGGSDSAVDEASPRPSAAAAAEVVVEALDGIASRLRGDATSSEGVEGLTPSLPPYHYLTIVQTSSSMYTLMSYLGAVSVPTNDVVVVADDADDEDASGEERELVLRSAVRALLSALVQYRQVPRAPSSPRSTAADLSEKQPSIIEEGEGDEESDEAGRGEPAACKAAEAAEADVASRMEVVEAEEKKARNLRCALRDSFAAFERLINLIDFYSAKALLAKENLKSKEKERKRRTLLILRDLLRLGTAACKGCESNKVSFVRASLRNGQNKRQSSNGGTSIGGGVWAVMSALQSSSCEGDQAARSHLQIEVQTEACKLLTVLCRFDDFRAESENSAPGSQFGMTVSSAHDHATAFHRAGAVPLVSIVASSALSTLGSLEGTKEKRRIVSLAASSMSALRVVAINDEIVQTVVAAGSLDTARIALKASSSRNSMDGGTDQIESSSGSSSAALLASASLGLIRNLCGNDGIKTTLCLGSGSSGSDTASENHTDDNNNDDAVAADVVADAAVPTTTSRHHPSALPSILATMERYPTDPSIQEHGCGILAAMALRKPKNALVILESNGASAILTAMKRHPDKVAVQRQGCLAIRNVASRLIVASSSSPSNQKEGSNGTAEVSSASNQTPSPPPPLDVREHLLDLGAEHVLRAIAGRHQGSVDEAYAALRDLGCSVSMARVELGDDGGGQGSSSGREGKGGAARVVSSRVEMFGEVKPKFRPVFEESAGLADVVEEVAASHGM